MKGRKLDCSWCEAQQDGSAEIALDKENSGFLNVFFFFAKQEASYGMFGRIDTGREGEGLRSNKWEK